MPVGTSLRRLKLVGFIYVPVKRHGDVTVGPWTLILVITVDQFYFGIRQYVSLASMVVQSH